MGSSVGFFFFFDFGLSKGWRYLVLTVEGVRLGEGDSSHLEDGPLEALPVNQLSQEQTGQENTLQSIKLVGILVRLRGPGKEGSDILGKLGDRGISSILILDHIVCQLLRHSDLSAREVRVVAHARLDLNTGGGLLVTSKEREEVVLTSGASLNDQREINGVGSVVGSTSGVLVGVRGGNVVSELTRALEHLSDIIRSVLNLNISRDLLHLSLGVGDIDEVTVGDVL
jgi:hypothetical protein